MVKRGRYEEGKRFLKGAFWRMAGEKSPLMKKGEGPRPYREKGKSLERRKKLEKKKREGEGKERNFGLAEGPKFAEEILAMLSQNICLNGGGGKKRKPEYFSEKEWFRGYKCEKQYFFSRGAGLGGGAFGGGIRIVENGPQLTGRRGGINGHLRGG